MGISDIKRALGGKKPVRGSEVKPGKAASFSVEEKKKDASIFRGESHIEVGRFGHRLKDPNLFRTTGLGEKDRVELGKKLFGSYGSYIKPQSLEEVKRQIDLGGHGRFREMSSAERNKAKKFLKGISGK